LRGRGDAGFIGHGGDRTESLVGLLVSGDLTVGTSVDTWEILRFTLAALENVIGVRSGSVILATDTIKDVLAVLSRIGTRWIASLQAELSSTHEIVPFDGLDVVVRVSSRRRERIREQQRPQRVASLIGAMRVEFSARVCGIEVDEGLVDVASDLDVVWGLDKLDTSDGTSWDQTSSVAGLGAPGDTFTFDVTNERVGVLGSPQAKVVNAVDDGGLALGRLVFGRRVTDVVSGLGTTFTVVWVGLVGQSGVGEGLGSEGDEARRGLGVDEEQGAVGQDGGDGSFSEHDGF